MRPLLFIPLLLASCAPAPPEKLASTPLLAQNAHVTLRNFTAREIVVGLKNPQNEDPTLYAIPARTKREVELTAGTYTWAASAEKTALQKGSKTFAAGKSYCWDFNFD